MKKIEEIEKEYDSFSIQSDFVTNLDEFNCFMQVGIDDIDNALVSYKKELRDNRIWQIEARIRNIFFFLFQQEEEMLYDYDNDILKKVIDLTLKYKEVYKKILELGRENNYKELTKLVDFLADYYGKHMDYFEFSRDQLDAQARGFNLYNPRMEDNREVVDEFMKRKISQYEEKPIQLVKKENINV